MTPERKQQLEARLKEISDMLITRAVRDNFDGKMSAAEVAELMSDLAEFAACISVAYVALNPRALS